jgi:hypothetical protein
MCRKRLVLRHRNFGKSGRLVELCSCSEYLTTSIAVGASSMTTRSQGTGITPSRCRWSCPTCRTARSRAKRSELSTRIVRTPPPATAAKSLRFHCVMAASCGMLLRTVRRSFYAIDHGTLCLRRGRKCRKLMQKACQVGSRRGYECMAGA